MVEKQISQLDIVHQSEFGSGKEDSKGRQIKTLSHYKIHLDKCIGKGSFANVYLATDIQTDQQVAIKEISNKTLFQKLGPKGQENLMKELEICRNLKQKNIVKCLDFFKSEKNNYIVFEYCGGGDLKEYRQERRRFPEEVVQQFMHQLGQALKYLYVQNIVHRDIKLQNILLTEKSDNATLKLADFGLARKYQSQEDVFETQCGTPIYMAPEIQGGDSYNDKSDLWSVGTIMFELLCGFPPFVAQTRVELKIKKDVGKYMFPSDVKASQICTQLISSLLRTDPKKRIAWKDFFEHPFISFSSSDMYMKLLKEANMLNKQKVTIKERSDQSLASESQQQSKMAAEKPSLVQEALKQLVSEKVDEIIPAKVAEPVKHNSKSLTQEDLDETIEDILGVILLLETRTQKMEQLFQSEVKSKLTQELAQ